jgi:hypothetical protein
MELRCAGCHAFPAEVTKRAGCHAIAAEVTEPECLQSRRESMSLCSE